MDHKLEFRRQFILTQIPLPPPAGWMCLQVDPYCLYTHPDLEVHQARAGARSLVLIGCLFDPDGPEKGNADIVKDLLMASAGVRELFASIKRYAGRYALLYQDEQDVVILHDALALREIYYISGDNRIVCGSQPNLVAKYANPEIGPRADVDFRKFYESHSRDSRWDPRCKWIGDETYFAGVKHLLPNHYLDIKKHQALRYWPDRPIPRLSLDEAVSRSAEFLQNMLRAMAHRHKLMIAVTAGTDSRTILAASRNVADKVYYYVNNLYSDERYPDITIPKRMFEGIGIPFHIHEVPKGIDENFRRIFLNNAFFASDRILPAIYNVYYKKMSDFVNVLGIGEIGRTRYGKEPKKLNGFRLFYRLGYRSGRYVARIAEEIRAELSPVCRSSGINPMTLFYWEHTLGNWGVTGNSESDIAIEEINPFDSHQLYEIFLGIDARFVKYTRPVFFKELIRRMWPELLEWPINPPFTIRDKSAAVLKNTGLFEPLKELKYRVHYFKYLADTKRARRK